MLPARGGVSASAARNGNSCVGAVRSSGAQDGIDGGGRGCAPPRNLVFLAGRRAHERMTRCACVAALGISISSTRDRLLKSRPLKRNLMFRFMCSGGFCL